METYDVVVVGAGPGGYVCAIRSAQAGLKTAIVDKQWLGGVCLNVGCIPSKALLKNAEFAHSLRERAREFGASFDNLSLDFGSAVKRSRQVSDRLTKGIGFLMKKNHIDVHMGTAELISAGQIAVSYNDGRTDQLQAKNIVIATGASPISIPGVNVDGKRILNYLSAILQPTLPASVVIIGAGAIGVEFATVWNSYGAKVTLVEMLPHILPLEDAEVSEELTKNLTRQGIQILTGTKVQGIDTTETGVTVHVRNEQGEIELQAEQALVSIGFRPNSRGFGLENLGVAMNERGAIQVNDKMATNIPGVWAIGDVTGKLMLAHVASAMGLICADTIAGKETRALDYPMMPRATYCRPQVASFGFTESQLKEKGLPYKIGKFPFLANGKALGLAESSGFVKILTDAANGKILGAHMVGPEVSELLPELTLAANAGLPIEEIILNVHAHPTLSETLMEAAHGADGQPIHL